MTADVEQFCRREKRIQLIEWSLEIARLFLPYDQSDGRRYSLRHRHRSPPNDAISVRTISSSSLGEPAAPWRRYNPAPADTSRAKPAQSASSRPLATVAVSRS